MRIGSVVFGQDHTHLGNQARDERNWNDAAYHYARSLKKASSKWPIWVQYGHVLKEAGHLEEAEAAYRRAVALAPGDTDAHLHLAHLLKNQGKRKEAEEFFVRLLQLGQPQEDVIPELRTLGWSAARLASLAPTTSPPAQNPPSASHQPIEKPQKRPRVRNTSNLIASADRARDARQWTSAVQLYRAALDREPRNAPIWVQYGHALKESGHPEEAAVAYRRSLAFQPNAADSYLQLGHVLKLLGRPAEAEAAYLRALVLDPSLSHSASELRSLGWSAASFAELEQMRPASPEMKPYREPVQSQ
jgi:tetratricopeptide (TPR) repeat protein